MRIRIVTERAFDQAPQAAKDPLHRFAVLSPNG
jgi:hypothetical protein